MWVFILIVPSSRSFIKAVFFSLKTHSLHLNHHKISLLPDCLLLEIISRLELSTKQVIKTTSTISKRWQHLWTRLPILVFIINDMIRDGVPIDDNVVNTYCSFIDKTLAQCPSDVNLKKFKLLVFDVSGITLQLNRWIRYAIKRNVEDFELRMQSEIGYATCNDEFFFNNSCLISMKLSSCDFVPPNGVIRWDKLKCLCIDRGGLYEDLIGKILSGSPCLETLELNCCQFEGRIPMSLFGKFGVLERLSCDLKTYERLSYDDELLGDESEAPISMKFSRCVFNPPNGAIRWDKLKFLCIAKAELYERPIAKILSLSSCLETLQLNDCCDIGRIDITSTSVKKLVLSYTIDSLSEDSRIEINAPYIVSLTIKGGVYLKEILLENMSSLVKADLNYYVSYDFPEEPGRDQSDVEEELLRGLLSSLSHVNEIVLGDCYCLQALIRLEAKGFQFRKGSDLISGGSFPGSYRIFSLIHE